MKKLLLVLLLFGAFTSCNKSPHVWECTILTEIDYDNNEVVEDDSWEEVHIITSQEKNYDEVFEQQNTDYVYYNSGYSKTTSCNCIEQ
jgi:hypothetical protein